MSTALAVEPDLTLRLDANGVIRTAAVAGALAQEPVSQWRGRPWAETLAPAEGSRLAALIGEAGANGASSLLQITHRFPSGRELPMEYSAVSLGAGAGFIAIGKSLQAVANLEARLQEAIQAREQDYWRLREIEARYRMVLDASSEAVMLVRTTNLRIVEANLAATRALSLLPGSEFLPDLSPRERKLFEAMLDSVREQGRAPGIILHLGRDNTPWSLRASSMDTENGSFFLMQLAPVGTSRTAPEGKSVQALELIHRLPDAFVIVDREGIVKSANLTFLDLVQIGAEGAVIGQNVNRWLSRPGGDGAAIIDMVERHGSVSMLPTVLYGQFGSQVEVEVSAVANRDSGAEHFALLLRDVTARRRRESAEGSLVALADPLLDGADGFSLEQFVKSATAAIEQRLIASALARSDDNRTVAAKKLGLSRQSLHTKLKRYNFD